MLKSEPELGLLGAEYHWATESGRRVKRVGPRPWFAWAFIVVQGKRGWFHFERTRKDINLMTDEELRAAFYDVKESEELLWERAAELQIIARDLAFHPPPYSKQAAQKRSQARACAKTQRMIRELLERRGNVAILELSLHERAVQRLYERACDEAIS